MSIITKSGLKGFGVLRCGVRVEQARIGRRRKMVNDVRILKCLCQDPGISQIAHDRRYVWQFRDVSSRLTPICDHLMSLAGKVTGHRRAEESGRAQNDDTPWSYVCFAHVCRGAFRENGRRAPQRSNVPPCSYAQQTTTFAGKGVTLRA